MEDYATNGGDDLKSFTQPINFSSDVAVVVVSWWQLEVPNQKCLSVRIHRTLIDRLNSQSWSIDGLMSNMGGRTPVVRTTWWLPCPLVMEASPSHAAHAPRRHALLLIASFGQNVHLGFRVPSQVLPETSRQAKTSADPESSSYDRGSVHGPKRGDVLPLPGSGGACIKFVGSIQHSWLRFVCQFRSRTRARFRFVDGNESVWGSIWTRAMEAYVQ